MAENQESVMAEQYGYAARAKVLVFDRFGKDPKAFVHTYGCQQNVSDSEVLKGWLAEMGFSFCDTTDEADFVLFNTCAVREHAEDRVFGNVGAVKKHKKERPDSILAMCGCMTQQPHVADRIRRSYPYVDLLFGTRLRHRFPEFVYRILAGERRVFELGGEDVVYEGAPIRRDGTFKAWLPIMQGCNNFCTYCVVPHVRGRERSREPEDVLAEARELISGGAKEIMLLGQNVNSYGKGNACEMDFADLLRAVNDLPGDFRIRFMTSHPRDCTEKLLYTMRDCEKVCKNLHLPVQSGSDRVLKEMNRHYDTKRYLYLVDKARELMPNLALTTDLIVGFPTETAEDFEETLRLVERVKYRALFTFIFSPRKGTPAAEMEDPTPAAEKSARFAKLLRLQEEIADKATDELLGKEVTVLVEEEHGGKVSGKDEAGLTVTFDGTAADIGTFCRVKLTEVKPLLIGARI